jgi:hypothetical protein
MQAFGWAWYLRLSMSWYSLAQAAHMVNADIVVIGRSYGMSSIME